ncbi:MAG TPA: MATE family efflux transporter [Longimicrobiales bacterium]
MAELLRTRRNTQRAPGASEYPPPRARGAPPAAQAAAPAAETAPASTPEAASSATAGPEPEAARDGGWLAVALDAVRGRGGDPTHGPVGRAIVSLAVPMILEMAMESVFAVVDIFFVSRLGAAAVATVGLTESLLTVVYIVAAGLSIGATALVARRTGAGEAERAAEAAGQAIALGAGLSAALGAAGVAFAPALLRAMGADADVLRLGTGYATVMLGGSGTVVLLFLINAAFRGAGDAAIAMRILWIANGLNIVLDPLLIFGIGPFPELGVTGAAVATTASRGLGVALQLATLLRANGRLRLAVRHIRIRPTAVGRLLRLSAAGTLQAFIGGASWIFLIRIVSGFGSEAVAGYTVAIRVTLFALQPAWGLANAAATMVGQGLGAGDPARAERSVWIASGMNLAFLGAISVLFLLAAPTIVDLFGADPTTAGHAVRGLRILSPSLVFYAVGMVVAQSFNGAGAPWTPTTLSLVCFWLWEIPLAWTLSHTAGLGPDGVFSAIAVAFSTLSIAATLLFRRGRWKSAVV